MKALLHAYFWRQKVLPSESIIKPQSAGDNSISNGHVHIHAVALPPPPPYTLSSTEYDCTANLVHNPMIRSRRASQVSISNKGEDMAPLCIERDLKSAVDRYM